MRILRPRINGRSLMVLVLEVCGVLGWIVRRAREQQDRVAHGVPSNGK